MFSKKLTVSAELPYFDFLQNINMPSVFNWKYDPFTLKSIHVAEYGNQTQIVMLDESSFGLSFFFETAQRHFGSKGYCMAVHFIQRYFRYSVILCCSVCIGLQNITKDIMRFCIVVHLIALLNTTLDMVRFCIAFYWTVEYYLGCSVSL